jgi:hypothetical protein
MELHTTNWTLLLWQVIMVVAIIFIGYKVYKILKKV